MASLSDMMIIARSGVLTHQERLAVISHNITNVNTPGYIRQKAVLGTNPPNSPTRYSTRNYDIGTGVRIEDVIRTYSSMKEATLLGQLSDYNRHAQLANALPELEALVQGNGDASLATCFQEFWTAWQDVATNPENLAMRNVLLEKSGALADQFNELATRLDNYRGGIASGAGPDFTGIVPDIADEINTIATRIQALNKQITVAENSGITANDLMNQRDTLIRSLSEKTDIAIGADKTITIDGQILVSGDGVVRNDLTVTSTNPIALTIDGANVTITGGELGGWLQTAAISETLRSELDAMANELATQVNALHTTGYDLDGNLGLDFFTGAGADGIAVNNLIYNDTNPLLNNPRLVAAAQTLYAAGPPPIPNTGDGAIALAIADLCSTDIAALDGLTFNNYLANMLTSLGTTINTEQALADSGETVVNTLLNAIQSESGVNLDEEMIDMISAQRAFQAASRLVVTIDEMMDVVINRMG